MDFLTEAFSSKGITPSTLKLYKANLQRLNNNTIPTSIKFLKSPEKILNQIKTKKPNTQRSYIISIVSLLSTQPKAKKLYDIYFDILTKLNADLKDQTAKTPKETTNWMTKEELKEFYNSKAEALKSLPTPSKLTKQGYDDLLSFTILSLYFLQPPRRNIDYQLMYIIPKFNEDLDKSKNYYSMKDKMFYFNNYKTKGTYRTQSEPVSKEMQDVLKIYFKYHPNRADIKSKKEVPLLVESDGSSLGHSNSITRKLYKIFGKKIGSSMLRKMYLTNNFKHVLDELDEATKAMGTSVETARNNYIKKD